MKPSAPLQNHRCPLCGGANACAAALSGCFDVPCWCRSASFPPGLVASVPEAEGGLSCICASCAKAHPIDIANA